MSHNLVSLLGTPFTEPRKFIDCPVAQCFANHIAIQYYVSSYYSAILEGEVWWLHMQTLADLNTVGPSHAVKVSVYSEPLHVYARSKHGVL